MLYIWIAAIVVLLVIEIATTQLVTIWFAVGALAGLIGCICDLQLAWQMTMFVVVSAIALILTRPLVKKFYKKEFSPTNADRCIGQTAVVTEDISNTDSKGAVKLNGTEWTARSLAGEDIPAGSYVKIEKIDGVKLIVTKQEVM